MASDTNSSKAVSNLGLITIGLILTVVAIGLYVF